MPKKRDISALPAEEQKKILDRRERTRRAMEGKYQPKGGGYQQRALNSAPEALEAVQDAQAALAGVHPALAVRLTTAIEVIEAYGKMFAAYSRARGKTI